MVKKRKLLYWEVQNVVYTDFHLQNYRRYEEILPDSNLLNNNEIFQMFFCLNFEDDIIKNI